MTQSAYAAALPATIDLLEALVGFDTVSDKSNLPLIDFVADYLKRHAIPFVRLPNEAGDKAAIFATIGPQVPGGVVLSGHTDVVPVAGQAWTGDPFQLRCAGDRLYGRGACDMKGFDACMLGIAPLLAAMPLKRPVHLLLSYDEETTCLGVMDAIARFGKEAPMPRAVIVGEPTLMQVADSHKGIGTYFTHVTGFEVHSSMPDLGVNAVQIAAKLIFELGRIGEEIKRRGDPTGRFDPPYTSVHVGTVQGGTARNITAKDCRFHWEFRSVPGHDDGEIAARLAAYAERDLLPGMRAVHPGADIVTTLEVNVPALAPEPGSAAETLALRLSGSNATFSVPYCSEASRFQKAGVPTVVCGPGAIDQAHQPDEWIAIPELNRCLDFLNKLGLEQCA